MEDCKGRREFEGVARLKPACLSAKHGDKARFLEFLECFRSTFPNAFFPTPVGFLAMALLWHYLLLLRFLLLCCFIHQISTKPIGTDRNRPESRPKLRGQSSLYESAALGTCRASGLRCRCFGGCSLGSLYRRCCVVFARFPL